MTRFSLAALLAVLVFITSVPVFAQVGEPPDDPLNYQRQPFDGQHRQQGGPTTYQAPQPEPAPTKEPVDQAAPAAKANPTPADPPVRQAAGPVSSYSDGRSQKQAQQWANGQDQGPAYQRPVTQVIDRTINRTVYVANGASTDEIFNRAEELYIKSIPIKKINNIYYAEEPAPRHKLDRRKNRKLVYDNAAKRGYVRITAVGDGFQAIFRPEKKDEIVTWILAELNNEVATALQETFRNFLVDEFEPLKAQVGTNTANLNSLVEWAETQGYQPPTATKEAATVVTEEETTEEGQATESEQAENATTEEEAAAEAQPTNAQVLAAVQDLSGKLDESAKADEAWRLGQSERDQAAADKIGQAVAKYLPTQPVQPVSNRVPVEPTPSWSWNWSWPDWGWEWAALPAIALLLGAIWVIRRWTEPPMEALEEGPEEVTEADPAKPPPAKGQPPATKKTLPGEQQRYGVMDAPRAASSTLPPPPTTPAPPKTEPEEPESLFGGGAT